MSEVLPDQPIRPGNGSDLSGRRVLIHGMGRSGLATADLLTHHKIRFGFYDDQEILNYRALSSKIRWPEVEVHFREISGETLQRYDLVITSPGVPAHSPMLMAMKKAGLKVISEIELASGFAKAPVVAVTGTNGKTTTCTMAQLLLSKAGRKAVVTGNIGYPFTTAVMDDAPDFFVVEVSSFQLHHVDRFAPQFAVITGFAPNHLDWHGDLDDYFSSKMNVTRNMGSDHVVIFPVGQTRIHEALSRCPARQITFGPGGDVSLDGRSAEITARTREGKKVSYVRLETLASQLGYDYRNVSECLLAVTALACALDLPASTVEAMLTSFVPLKHRIEVVRNMGGVMFVNDSKATSVDATAFALGKQSRPVVLMLGGRDKGLCFAELLPASQGKVRAVVAFGEAREKIAREIGGELTTHLAVNLDEAVDRACHLAQSGDVVLFSPGCASYDQFKNYEERGDAFRRIVNEL